MATRLDERYLKAGRITRWNDERGFGFITPDEGGEQVFVHISALTRRSRRPLENDAVTYTLTKDAQGRSRAARVTLVAVRDEYAARANLQAVQALAIAAAFLAVVVGLAFLGRIPPALLLVYLVASVVGFAAYAWDKSKARRAEWRTMESTLHIIALVGGWPGALVARHIFRHKSSKRSFVNVFRATVACNCTALGWLVSPLGQTFLASLE